MNCNAFTARLLVLSALTTAVACDPMVDGSPIASDDSSASAASTEVTIAGRAGTAIPAAATTDERGNILIVVIDDLGTDKLAAYDLTTEVPSTPTLDRLADDGVTFMSAYANPNCSPSRAALQTGRRADRLGIGSALGVQGDDLRDDEVTIAEMLSLGTDGAYASSLVGKWHLGSRRNDYLGHPNNQGWDHYSGSMMGLGSQGTVDGGGQDYWDWEKVTNGVPLRTTTYATTDTANDAVARIQGMPEPWVLVVSFNAPHAPYHWAPEELTSGVRKGTTTDAQKYNSMVEAVDTELARVLEAVDAHSALGTHIMVMGDNGTPHDRMEPGFGQGKGSPYEGGTRIPLIVSGPAVEQPGARSSALVEIIDVFATIADLTNIDPAALGLDIDGVSFAEQLRDPEAPSQRTVSVSERFNGDQDDNYGVRLGLRDNDHRLVVYDTHHELYALGDGFVEGIDLLAQPEVSDADLDAYDGLLGQLPAYWADQGF